MGADLPSAAGESADLPTTPGGCIFVFVRGGVCGSELKFETTQTVINQFLELLAGR
jgi:hypothetical protein